jgi:guanylate kinase
MIKLRLSNARRDIEEAHWYHYVIVNERAEEAIEKLKAIIVAERCRKKKKSILEAKMSQWEE